MRMSSLRCTDYDWSFVGLVGRTGVRGCGGRLLQELLLRNHRFDIGPHVSGKRRGDSSGSLPRLLDRFHLNLSRYTSANPLLQQRFLNCGRYIVTRDYLHVKFWDTHRDNRPLVTISIHEHLRPILCDLYESDSIFDKFLLGLSGDDTKILTGGYK